MNKRKLVVLALFAAAGTASAQCVNMVTLMANIADRQAAARLGWSMATAGSGAQTTVLAGAPFDDATNMNDAGAVYYFGQSGNQWGQLSKFRAGDAQIADQFGAVIGTDGSSAVVASPERGISHGGVYFFDRSGSQWVQNGGVVTKSNPQSFDYFGLGCDLEGNWAAVGAPFEDSNPGVSTLTNEGAVYIYKRSAFGMPWTLDRRITMHGSAYGPGNKFGSVIAMGGNVMVIGSPDQGGNAGTVEFWRRSGSTWTFDYYAFGQPGDRKGTALDTDGNTVVIGVPGSEGGRGEAYTMTAGGLGGDGYLPVTSDMNLTSASGFGSSVKVSGDRAIVGTLDGRAFIYKRFGSFDWRRVATVANPFGTSDSAARVSLVGTTVFAADRSRTGTLASQGAVDIFGLDPDVADSCEASIYLNTPTVPGDVTTVHGCTQQAMRDGDSTCGQADDGPDVYYTIVPDFTGTIRIDTEGSSYDTMLSVHSNCPATPANSVACDDDGGTGTASAITIAVQQNQMRIIRVAGFWGAAGSFTLNLRRICAADFNQDGQVDFFDYLDFVAAFDAEDPSADFNEDGIIDFFDYLDFAAALDSGC